MSWNPLLVARSVRDPEQHEQALLQPRITRVTAAASVGSAVMKDDPLVAPLRVIGYVDSSLRETTDAPRQPDEPFAPAALLRIAPEYASALSGLGTGDEIIVITWLHLADRSTLTVHPRGDRGRERTGVFATRSPDRPNPIGLHRATITSVESPVVAVSSFEAVDGTPILDIKPVLGAPSSR
jgi:tRNA-Thr(GGU) m(6)t(6)A37 methyltransferase TsaA